MYSKSDEMGTATQRILGAEDIEELSRAYDMLKEANMNKVDEIMACLREADVYDDSPAQTARVRSYFNDLPDEKVPREKFLQAVEQAIMEFQIPSTALPGPAAPGGTLPPQPPTLPPQDSTGGRSCCHMM